MTRELLFAVIAIGCLAPGAEAQERVMLERTLAPGQAPVEGRKVVVDAIETRITPDRPYSAEALTETTQVLADGNRINRQSVTRVYRDSAGRTRRDTLGTDGSVRTISISDPVAGVTYSLDPTTKFAYKTSGKMVAVSRTPGGADTREMLKPAASAGRTALAETKPRTTEVEGTGYARIARSREPLAGGGGRGVAVTTTRGAAKREPLEAQNIEGVMATGSRTTTIIPAGQIGNAQEIRIVSEQWFSDELQVLVLTKHSDPRSGETIYRLRNVLSAEPDPSLFTVPSDYTLRDQTMRREQ